MLKYIGCRIDHVIKFWPRHEMSVKGFLDEAISFLKKKKVKRKGIEGGREGGIVPLLLMDAAMYRSNTWACSSHLASSI